MTIGMWTVFAVGIAAVVGGITLGVLLITSDESGAGIISIVIGIVLGVAMILGSLIYSNTEEGKRSLKDQKSNFGAGIERTVEVYDINGKLIKEYSGKFDVETDNEKYVLFDDEEGKRHIIYFSTATVVIDEK